MMQGGRHVRRAVMMLISAAVAGLGGWAVAGAVLVVVVIFVLALCWVIANADRSDRLAALITAAAGRSKVLATSLYDDPAAGLCGGAPIGLDEHPEHGP